MNIFEYVNAKEIATFYTNSPYNVMAYVGEQLFPAKKQIGLDLSWVKGSKGLPVALKPSAFDTKATLRDRVGFSSVITEMPFFRESMRIGERDRQEMLKLMNADISAIRIILDNIFDDVAQLVESARVSAEIMRMQLLSTGEIAISDNRMVYDYDYSMPAENFEVLENTDTWDNAGADVLGNLQDWCDVIEDATGERPSRMLLNSVTFRYLRSNTGIKLLAYPGLDADNVTLQDADIVRVIRDVAGLSIAIYSKKYNNASGVATKFFPDDKVALLPAGIIGNTYFGTTPEEADLMSGGSRADVSIVQTGVAVTTFKEEHPVNIVTVVSAIMLPSAENLDKVFIATVS